MPLWILKLPGSNSDGTGVRIIMTASAMPQYRAVSCLLSSICICCFDSDLSEIVCGSESKEYSELIRRLTVMRFPHAFGDVHIGKHCPEGGGFGAAGINAEADFSRAFPHVAYAHLREG